MDLFASENLPLHAPELDETTAPYWAAAAEGDLLLPHCSEGHFFWIPRGFCSDHPASDVTPVRASGRGTVYSYTVVHRGEGAFASSAPYVLAYVELAEGPRVLSNIVDCREEDLCIGLPVDAVFSGDGTWALTRFQPCVDGAPSASTEETWI